MGWIECNGNGEEAGVYVWSRIVSIVVFIAEFLHLQHPVFNSVLISNAFIPIISHKTRLKSPIQHKKSFHKPKYAFWFELDETVQPKPNNRRIFPSSPFKIGAICITSASRQIVTMLGRVISRSTPSSMKLQLFCIRRCLSLLFDYSQDDEMRWHHQIRWPRGILLPTNCDVSGDEGRDARRSHS